VAALALALVACGDGSCNGAPQGAIDPLTSEWEFSFPVYEIGSTVTDVD